MFGTVNFLGMGTFSLLIPETKGLSLEEMDILFGSVTAESRQAKIVHQEEGENFFFSYSNLIALTGYSHFPAALDHEGLGVTERASEHSDHDQKV